MTDSLVKTPRTDAAAVRAIVYVMVPDGMNPPRCVSSEIDAVSADFCRQLERELIALTAQPSMEPVDCMAEFEKYRNGCDPRYMDAWHTWRAAWDVAYTAPHRPDCVPDMEKTHADMCELLDYMLLEGVDWRHLARVMSFRECYPEAAAPVQPTGQGDGLSLARQVAYYAVFGDGDLTAGEVRACIRKIFGVEIDAQLAAEFLGQAAVGGK